jgi:hypothetical protein
MEAAVAVDGNMSSPMSICGGTPLFDATSPNHRISDAFVYVPAHSEPGK